MQYVYGTITLYGTASQPLPLQHCFITPRPHGSSGKNTPTTPHVQHLPAITHARFSLIRFRSPLLTESLLFSFPMGTEMFHFPTFPQTPLYIQGAVAGLTTGSLQGFPIRKSPDHSSSTNSPGLIAGYNVLHRLLVPRHPPIALSSLPHNTRTPTTNSRHARTRQSKNYKDARVHYEVLNKQAAPHNQPDQQPDSHTTTQGNHHNAAAPSQPNSVPPALHKTNPKTTTQTLTGSSPPHPPNSRHKQGKEVFLRKEVIQPHLPVRLPCYDLVLITSPTFDGSPQKWTGHRLRVLPTFMT